MTAGYGKKGLARVGVPRAPVTGEKLPKTIIGGRGEDDETANGGDLLVSAGAIIPH